MNVISKDSRSAALGLMLVALLAVADSAAASERVIDAADQID